jgi:hypothetical protein
MEKDLLVESLFVPGFAPGAVRKRPGARDGKDVKGKRAVHKKTAALACGGSWRREMGKTLKKQTVE